MTWKSLSNKFTTREKEACRWLEDVGVRGWIVDLLTKQVTANVAGEVRKFDGLVAFADFHGWRKES